MAGKNGARILSIVFLLGFAVIGVSVANEYAAGPYHHEDLRVDEKEYAVDGGSTNYMLLGMPLLMIPLILLICTPIFQKPYDVPHHHHGEHQHHHQPSHGHGWGTYNLGWGRSVDHKEEITGRVMKGLTKKKSSSGRTKSSSA